MTATTLISILAPLATLTVGLIAGSIAYQQWRLACNKLNLDLFEKRHAVFVGFQQFLTTILRFGGISEDDKFLFQKSTANTRFLFGPELKKFQVEVWNRAMKLDEYNDNIRNIPPGPIKTELLKGRAVEFTWLKDELLLNLAGRFEPYISFSDVNRLSLFDRLEKKLIENGKYPTI